MKIIAETPEESRLLERIQSISDNMAVQDNRSTMMPMWTIMENGEAGKDYGAVMFFTQSEAEKHVRVNSHHYDHPGIYVRSAHDNPELQSIAHLLLLAGNNNIPTNHYRELR